MITASCGTCRELQTYHAEPEAVTEGHVKIVAPLLTKDTHTKTTLNKSGLLLVFSVRKLDFSPKY